MNHPQQPKEQPSNSGNVLDRFKGFSIEEVKNTLYEESLPYAVCMMQIKGDFNFSTLVRNANAFKAREVFYYGPRRRWDKRGAVGTYHYTPANWLQTLEEIKGLRGRYKHFVAMDIIPGVSTELSDHVWEPDSLLFFGEEQQGLQPEILDICDKVVHIPQGGSVRSINVGTASGISMHNIMSKLSS